MPNRMILWNVLGDPCLVQVFSGHIQMFFGEYHVDTEISEKTRHLSCTQWSEKWLARHFSMNAQAFFELEYCFYGVYIKRAHINHLSFANEAFTERDTGGFYFGTSVYQNVYSHDSGQYGEVVGAVFSSVFGEFDVQF